jgi:hypothetical protein
MICCYSLTKKKNSDVYRNFPADLLVQKYFLVLVLVFETFLFDALSLKIVSFLKTSELRISCRPIPYLKIFIEYIFKQPLPGFQFLNI